MKNFEYESCKEFQMLHFLFQALVRLRVRSKVYLTSRRMYVIRRFEFKIQISFDFCIETRKYLHMKVVHIKKMLQLWFWAKFCLSYVFEIIL